VPAIVDGSVVAMLYGDNIPSEAPIGPVSGLEAAMIEACARLRPASAQGEQARHEFSARAAARSDRRGPPGNKNSLPRTSRCRMPHRGAIEALMNESGRRS